MTARVRGVRVDGQHRRRCVDGRQTERTAFAVHLETLLQHTADAAGENCDRPDPDRATHEPAPIDAHRLGDRR